MKQDKQPNAVARLPKFSHDLSYSRSWTSSTGHIIPVVSDFLNAGETINCSIDLKTRMQPILRPAMLEIHQKIKYFFVPMDMLYSLFGAIRYQVNDYFSSQFAKSNLYYKDGFPLFDFFYSFGAIQPFESSLGGVNVFSPAFSGATKFSDINWSNDAAKFEMFDGFHQGCHRLLDSLGFDANLVFSGSVNSANKSFLSTWCYSPMVFPYKLLAYQAIYFNYFRDEDFEDNLNSLFNVDSHYSDTTPVQGSDVLNICGLRYVNRFKDFFTNVHPTALISQRSLLNTDSGLYLSEANTYLNDNTGNGTPTLAYGINSALDYTGLGTNTMTTSGFQNTVSSGTQRVQINASQLRLLFAVDKLLTVTGRARKRVDDQVLAHFGFNVPLDVKHNIQYLGEQDGSFIVNDVISTADTGSSGAVLGELAGKAFGRVLGNGVKKFTAPCDGVFMGVYYSMPKVRYDAGFDRQNAVTSRTDLFIPEFDHLGMQPLFHYQLDTYLASTYGAGIYGWQWRYEQWKRKYDTVSAAFKFNLFGTVQNNMLSAWSPIMQPDKNNVFAANVSYQALKVTPHDLDNIMVMPFVSAAQDIGDEAFLKPYVFYQYDPFLHDMFVSYKKLSTMSTFSVPNLDNNL